MKFSLDIETCCGVPTCPKFGKACDHALDPYRNEITIIGLYWEVDGKPETTTLRSAPELKQVLLGLGSYELTGFNLKWDLHTLATHGCEIPLDNWTDDVMLMATSYTTKVNEGFILEYAATRKLLNEQLPKGHKHRSASHHSLKVLAPFFLGVDPFWEDPTNHDSAEYVLKDCEYTYKLGQHLEALTKEEGSYDFYKNKLVPWVKLLHRMERRGIKIDLDMIEVEDKEAQRKSEEVKKQLDEIWAPAYLAYKKEKCTEISKAFEEKRKLAVEKAIQSYTNNNEKAKTQAAKDKVRAKHVQRLQGIADTFVQKSQEAYKVFPDQMNLNSPTQLTWIFKNYLKLDILDFDEEESTGKAVLQRLAGEGHKDVELFLEYRKQRKLVTAFFPTYRELQTDGVIHTSFHPNGARTGRLSSSEPNLQQVPGHLHKMFMARPGYKLITKDESAIEPRLIAFASSDLTLYEILKDGHDFHGFNTKIFFELDEPVSEIKGKYAKQREVGKEVGLALMYGAGRFRLQESAQKKGFVWDTRECKRKLDRFKESYETVYAYREIINACLLDGPICNVAGRLFSVPDPQDVFMKGLNTYIQGGASDLVWNSANRAQLEYDRLGLDAHVLLLVHDEIVVEAHNNCLDRAEKILEHCMTDYLLVNDLGRIELKVEGKVAERWEK